ncbi:unnamed protein product [Protopolystoma xenopodis]|uniref:Uncharacterized protein n=1 Tax=Protopolystoma xenopodis TaxID=117903 RepID=A0A3S5AD29_9PLAT|nr:unnamed protein product [Protopolystoma xenopodis]
MSPSFLLRCDRQEADVKRPIGHLTPTKATGNLGSSRDLSPVAFPSVAQLKATLLSGICVSSSLCSIRNHLAIVWKPTPQQLDQMTIASQSQIMQGNPGL